MTQLFINVVGHNASGKSTITKRLAEDCGLNRVSGDDFRNFVYDNVPYFKDTGLAKSTDKYQLLNPLVINYRLELSLALLTAGQNVIFDGSGTVRQWRSHYMNQIQQRFPKVKRIIVYTMIREAELLSRLNERDILTGQTLWREQYLKKKKSTFESPTANELRRHP